MHPSARYRLLSKILNNVTTRSNSFGVFVTVQYYEAAEVSSDVANLNAIRIGGRLDDTPTHRGYFVVDRTGAVEQMKVVTPNPISPNSFSFKADTNRTGVVITGVTSSSQFTVGGDSTALFPAGSRIRIAASSGTGGVTNDGPYFVSLATFSILTNTTTVTIDVNMPPPPPPPLPPFPPRSLNTSLTQQGVVYPGVPNGIRWQDLVLFRNTLN
ncbi:MAG: hypothetical protein NTW75_15260 [Planctomycetales bacterium]|nr:hypothetical protein [Planctomycetales bacterium]